MKILDVYDKNSFKDLTCGGNLIYEMIDNYFSMYPVEYRKNYDTNLKTVEILRVDDMLLDNSGEYDADNNRVKFTNFKSLPHELMHMASYDKKKKKMAFAKDVIDFELGLVEGMTEYLAMEIIGEVEPQAYHFPVFCVSMLAEIPSIFEHYFIPNYDKFLGLFPNKRDILNLMYALDYYNESIYQTVQDNEKIALTIRDTIDALIDIELSMESDIRELRLYKEKFMDLLNNDTLDSYLGEFFPDYVDYANCELTQRLIKKR